MRDEADWQAYLKLMHLPPNTRPSPPTHPRPWHCDPLTPVCISGHPFITLKENQHRQTIEYAGHAHVYFICTKCQQSAFGIQVEQPSPLLTLYACTSEELEHARTALRGASSLAVLTYLGYASRGAHGSSPAA